MTIALIIAWVLLFGFRIALIWLANKYEFFGQWLVITTLALIVVSVFLAIDLVMSLMKRYAEMRNMFPKSESQSMQVPTAPRKREKDRWEARAERREEKAKRRAEKKAYRDKIRRVEAYEQRFWQDRNGN